MSIIVLTYNCKNVIIDSLRSILSQNFLNDDCEVIIIDDFSRDGTQSIIDDFIGNKEKVKFIKLNKNHGNGYCKNLGLRVAKGEVVFFLDDHLKLEGADTIKKMYNFLQQHQDVAGVCGNYISSNKNDYNICRDIRRFMIYNKNNKNLILSPRKFIPFPIVISALNVKKISGLSFPEDFKKNAAEDILFQIQAHEKRLEFAYLAGIIAHHDHNLDLLGIIIKSKRELNGFSYVLEKMIGNEYFRTIYSPYFFSFPLLLWVIIIINFFVPWTISITLLVLTLELIILLPIFKFPIKTSIKFKTLLYCLLTEVMKLFYILKVIIKRPKKTFSILTQLIRWEVRKLIFIYEDRFKKPGPHKIIITEPRS